MNRTQASIFLAFSVLITAPVNASPASQGSDAEYLERYRVFDAQRRADLSRPSTAKFSGNLVFNDSGCQSPVGGSAPSYQGENQCPCPTGNRYLECLNSVSVTIAADQIDVGGKGYVLLESSNNVDSLFVLLNGKWVSGNEFRGVAYSAKIAQIKPVQTIQLPISSSSAIQGLCHGESAGITVSIAYGAAMPMDIEMARRTKEKSAALNTPYDEEKFLMSKVMVNPYRPRNGGIIGQVSCSTAP